MHLQCVFYTIQNPDCIGPQHVNVTCVFTCTQTSIFASLYVCVFYTVQHNEKIAIVAPFSIRYCGTVPTFNVLSGGTPAQITCTLSQYMCTFNGNLQIWPTQLKKTKQTNTQTNTQINKHTNKHTNKQTHKRTNKQTNNLLFLPFIFNALYFASATFAHIPDYVSQTLL